MNTRTTLTNDRETTESGALSRPAQRLADILLELRIQWHFWMGYYADRSKARVHWLLMANCIRKRSPQQIARMEKRLGIG